MDVVHSPDNHIMDAKLYSRDTHSDVVFGVRAQLQRLLQGQQDEEQQQEQVLPLQRSLEMGQS